MNSVPYRIMDAISDLKSGSVRSRQAVSQNHPQSLTEILLRMVFAGLSEMGRMDNVWISIGSAVQSTEF